MKSAVVHEPFRKNLPPLSSGIKFIHQFTEFLSKKT